MANTPYMIINNPVYVYDSDSSRSKIINALPIGTRIDTAYEKNGWLKLLTSGWILKTPDVILDQDKFNSAFIDSTEEANRIFNESLDALSEDLRSHVEGMLSGNDFKDITLGGQQAIIEAYNQLSKQYDQAGVDALDNLLKEAGDKADAVSNIMKDIDWSSTDAEKQFEDALKEAKIDNDIVRDCHKCVYEVGCHGNPVGCKSYKRDAPDGGYYG